MKTQINSMLLNSLLKVSMHAVYNDSLCSFTEGAVSNCNRDTLKKDLCDFVDAVAEAMVSGELDPFVTDPREWMSKNGYIIEDANGLQ